MVAARAEHPHGVGPRALISARSAANTGPEAPAARRNHDHAPGSPRRRPCQLERGDLDGYLELDDAIRLHGYTPEHMSKAEVRGFYGGDLAAFGSPARQQ